VSPSIVSSSKVSIPPQTVEKTDRLSSRETSSVPPVEHKSSPRPSATNVSRELTFPDASVKEEISDLSGNSIPASSNVQRIVPKTPERRVMLDEKSLKRESSASKPQATPIAQEKSLSYTPSINQVDGFEDLRKHIQPVSSHELQEVYQLLRYLRVFRLYDFIGFVSRYDMHREFQNILREQVRQFAITKVCY
jgi:hypothetical protein